ncbi:MAG: hypothetical protein IKB24_04800 [Alistipes sp.]|nr:hypothetical protein [Alistipes sp.]
MKKIIKNLMLVAVAAMGFVACQDGVDEVVVKPQDTVSVEFTASFDETRSQFGEKVENSGYPSSWSGGEQIMLSLNETTPVIAQVESEGATANFTATLTSDGNTEGSIFAFSPAGTYENGVSTPGFTGISADYDSAYVYIPSEQSPIANSCDENVHLLAAECAYTDGIPASANLSFAPVAAFGKMTITDFEGTIANVTLESSEPLAGNAYYYYAGEKVGTLVKRDSGYVNTLTLDATNVQNNVFWFGCIPAVLDDTTLTVVVTDTEEKTYTKNIDLTDKKLAFKQGRVANFAVSFKDIAVDEVVDPSTFAYQLVTDASQLSVGKYVIIAAADYSVAMSTDQKSNNRGEATIAKYDNIAEVSESETVQVQYILLEEGAVANTYAFNVGNGYLFAASSNSNYLRTEATLSANSSWTITIETDGTATIIAQGTNTRNLMQYNQNSSLFSCYSNSQKALALYVGVDPSTVVKKSPLVTPTVVAEANGKKITVTWNEVENADNYTVICDEQTETISSNDELKAEFTVSKYATEYTVSVVANPADDSELYHSSEAGETSVITGADPREVLGTPELVAGEITASSITVSWSAVKNATNYDVYLDGTLKGNDITENTYTFNDLASGNEYSISVVANGDAELYLPSEAGVITVSTTGQATSATLSFADKAQRTSYSTSQQVWEQNGITFTNNKASSSTNVGDYANPVRLYANSEVIVEYGNMKKIDFTCGSSSYATALKNSIGTVDGVTVTVLDSLVTVEFNENVDSFTIAKLTAQVRIKSLTVSK